MQIYNEWENINFSCKGDEKFLIDCANEFIASLKGRDSFQVYVSNASVYPTIWLNSLKQNVQYRLDRYINTINIIADICYPSTLRKMPTSFWRLFIELDMIGNLTFLSLAPNQKIQSKLNQNKSKSVIYNLIKEIVLMDEHDNFSVDFECLQISFNLLNEPDNLSEKILSALTQLHKINKQLQQKSHKS